MFKTEVIKDIAHSTHTASAVFLSLSQRRRPRRILNLNLLMDHLKEQGVTIQKTDFYSTFKSLQKEGVGNLIYGRKGNPDVFVWFYNFLDLAEIGLGDVNKNPSTVKKIGKQHLKLVKDEKIELVDSAEKAAIETKVQALSVKDGYITIQIPLQALKTLPF